MDQDLHHPSPRLPDGWKQFQADNIDVTTTSDILPPTSSTSGAIGSGRHSRSPSVLSNHGFSLSVQPSQMQQQGNNNMGDNMFDDSFGGGDGGGDLPMGGTNSSPSQFGGPAGGQRHPSLSPFSSDNLPYPNNNPELRQASGSVGGGVGNGYFHPAHQGIATCTATHPSTTLNANPSNNLSPGQDDNNNNTNSNIDDFYLGSTDPSSTSPFLSTNQFVDSSSTSPPVNLSDPYSPFAPFHNPFDAQQNQFQQQQFEYQPQDTNSLGLHWTHHRSRSDQSDISSNASPFIGSVHSEHGSPFIGATNDTNLEDDLREAIFSLDMGAQFDVPAQYNQFDTSTLELDQNSGFPVDAQPLFDRQDSYREYYDRQSQQATSRPTSSHSAYHHPTFNQSIFSSAQPGNISTTIPAAFTSPPLASATSIPEIEVTVAPPTPRTQHFQNLDSYFSSPQPYHPSRSAHNSPSLPPSYIFNSNPDITPLALPGGGVGRRRAVSDSGTRPNLSMMPHTTLARRVSSGSHPYLGVDNGSPSSSGRSSPNRGHRRTVSSGHNMTHREVLDLVKNDGPREAKNPKKFICDYPGCGQRFTRNSNKT